MKNYNEDIFIKYINLTNFKDGQIAQSTSNKNCIYELLYVDGIPHHRVIAYIKNRVSNYNDIMMSDIMLHKREWLYVTCCDGSVGWIETIYTNKLDPFKRRELDLDKLLNIADEK